MTTYAWRLVQATTKASALAKVVVADAAVLLRMLIVLKFYIQSSAEGATTHANTIIFALRSPLGGPKVSAGGKRLDLNRDPVHDDSTSRCSIQTVRGVPFVRGTMASARLPARLVGFVFAVTMPISKSAVQKIPAAVPASKI